MSLREAGKAILSSRAIEKVLSRAGRLSGGKRALKWLSGSRAVFCSFEEGWAAARSTGRLGHEDPTRITLHLNLPENLLPGYYPALFWLTTVSHGAVKVFDFGGNVGNVFYSYGTLLERLGPVDWTVFDIPPVVEEGRRIARERKAEGLHFATSVEEYRADQVLLASGYLHYWEGTIAGFVEQFPVRPKHVIVNRSPMTDTEPSFVVVQQGATCAFPCIVRNAKAMITEFGQMGYRLVDRWADPQVRISPPLFPDQSVPHYSGFYFCDDRELSQHWRSWRDFGTKYQSAQCPTVPQPVLRDVSG